MKYLLFRRRREIAEVHLDIEYRCSKCGKVTHSVSLFQAMAYRRFSIKKIFDVPTPLEKVAFDTLDHKLADILDDGNADRYENANLRCACSFCGHREPWAKMHYDKVDYLIRLISTLGLLISFPFVLLFFLAQLPIAKGTQEQFSTLFDFFAIAVTILAATWFLRFLRRSYKRWHRQKLHRAIVRLAPESLPCISFDPREKKISPRRSKFTDIFFIYFLAPDGFFKL